jgi:hypothetical protein
MVLSVKDVAELIKPSLPLADNPFQTDHCVH